MADEKCLPPEADPNEGKTRKEIFYDSKYNDDQKKPFVPGNPSKKGLSGYFGHVTADGSKINFPEHIPEDHDAKTINGAKERYEAIPEKLRDRAVFMPSSTPKSYAVHSVVKKGLHSSTIARKK